MFPLNSFFLSVYFYGEGAGDLYIKAECTFVSETYSLEDCTYYDTLYTDKNSYSTTQGSASLTYNNGLTVTGTANTDTLVKNNVLTLPSKYTATFEIIARTGVGTNSFGGLIFDNLLLDFSSNSSNSIRVYNFSNLSNIGNFNNSVIQIGDVLKIEMDTGTVKFYVNNVLKGTYSVTSTGIHYFRTYNNRTLGIKNLKVKPL